jgi:hypothetical protein
VDAASEIGSSNLDLKVDKPKTSTSDARGVDDESQTENWLMFVDVCILSPNINLTVNC